ncbi:uncharacterized protein [Rutidosis leptorrhynchoides]|uniref:uncharacterized protein n=1 Tax=Rutidosis leptorrhynchoides TaxID=125765 RepID=UPI003A9A37C3
MFGSKRQLQKYEKQKLKYNPQPPVSKSISSSPAFQSSLHTRFRPFSQHNSQPSVSKTPFPTFNPQVSLSKTPFASSSQQSSFTNAQFRHFLGSVHDNSSSSTSNHEHSSSSKETPVESILNAENNQLNEHENEEVEIIDTNGNIIRKQRMTTKDVDTLVTGEKVLVHLNGFDQPIKSGGSLCTRFMGRCLKQQRFCPIEAKDWREIKMRCDVMLMQHIRKLKVLLKSYQV